MVGVEVSNRPITGQIKPSSPNHLPNPPKLWWLLVTVLLVMLAKPFIEYDDNGIPRLARWRQEKLNKELNELDGAEQYVLLAEDNGLYPCFSCVDSSTIYLRKGQVWKYGMTSKGQQGRYQNTLPGQRLHYVIEFVGTIEQCLQEERRKIYGYALRPENLVRAVPLIRPPGNKRDN